MKKTSIQIRNILIVLVLGTIILFPTKQPGAAINLIDGQINNKFDIIYLTPLYIRITPQQNPEVISNVTISNNDIEYHRSFAFEYWFFIILLPCFIFYIIIIIKSKPKSKNEIMKVTVESETTLINGEESEKPEE